MRTIFLLLLPVFIFAQFGIQQLDPNRNDFEDNATTGWAAVPNNVIAITGDTVHAGSYALRVTYVDAAAFQGASAVLSASGITVANLTVGKTYRGIAWAMVNSVSCRVSIDAHYMSGAGSQYFGTTWARKYVDWTHDGGSTIALTSLNTNRIGYIDDISIRERLDTLRVDSLMADDTDNDTTKTVKGAFDRGSWSGGTYEIIGDHTGEAKATLDSSGTMIYGTNTAVVDTIDFNSKTWTVNLDNLTINVKLNDSNVTYYTTPAATTKKRGYGKFGGFGNYLR